MKRIILLTVFIFFGPGLAFAQSLGINSDSVTVSDDTVSFNQLINFSIPVENTGNAAFNGTFYIAYTVNDSFQVETDTTFAQLSVGESITISEIELIDPVEYSIGDNIVVIWPVSINPPVPTTDSAIIHIFVDTALSVGPHNLKTKIKAWYNPNNRSIYLKYDQIKNEIEGLSLYTVVGDCVLNTHEITEQISLKYNPPQLYMLVVRKKDGARITFKIPAY